MLKANGCIERVLTLLPQIEFAQCICDLMKRSVDEDKNWLLVQGEINNIAKIMDGHFETKTQ